MRKIIQDSEAYYILQDNPSYWVVHLHATLERNLRIMKEQFKSYKRKDYTPHRHPKDFLFTSHSIRECTNVNEHMIRLKDIWDYCI